MTSHSLVPKSAGHTGVDFADLCIEILKTAHGMMQAHWVG